MAGKIKRMVIKVGTSTPTHKTGKLNLKTIEKLVRIISDLKNRGIEVVLVSSGAIGAGVGKLGLSGKPAETVKKQALAAIGQAILVSIYDRFFSEYGHTSAQVLITSKDIEEEAQNINIKNTFNSMFSYGVIPIVNENDAVSSYEIEYGDNDTLSAYAARLIEADMLVILSDIDGLLDSDPNINPNANLIPVVEKIDDKILSLAGGAGTKMGTGGMQTKLTAAKIVTEAGIDMVITNGKRLESLYDIVELKSVGTLFKAN